MIHDVAIIGAGPAGLCLARALSGQGLSIVLLERQAAPALEGMAETGGVAVAARVVVDQLVDGAGSMFAERVGAGQGGAEQAAKTDGASEGFDHFTFLVVGWEEKRQESNSRMRAGNLSAQTD